MISFGMTMSDLPVLGVAIPAYRRPDQLRRCIRSIVRSVQEAGSPVVPIHVTDDSCDETNVAALKELRGEYPHVVHHRNTENLGIDRNILRSVDTCAARHVWIMGEDDRMTPEAISTVLAVLRSGDRPFVYVNYASIDESATWVLAERSLPLERDVEMDASEFLATSAWSTGFIGACVVQRALWDPIRPDRYVGTSFAHVGRILEYLRGRRAYLVSRPVVLNRCGTARTFTWAASSMEVLEGFGRMLDLLRGLYPDDVRALASAAFRRAHALGTVRFFCYLRADGALDAKVHESHVRDGPYPALSRHAAWLIARTPPALFRGVRSLLRTFRRARNRRISGY